MDSMTRWMAANDRLLFFPWKKKKKKRKSNRKTRRATSLKTAVHVRSVRPRHPVVISSRRRRSSTRDGDGSSIRPEPNVM
jgi:hypothetical protein